MSAEPLRLGTRASALALAQAESVAELLPGAEIVPVKADDGPADDKSRFVRGVEDALLAGEVDIGVHSAKDLPSVLPGELVIAGVTKRESPADAWIGEGDSLDDVAQGARVGTASLRRSAQLLAARADLELVELHGNVDTRLEKLTAGEVDALVLASAGLHRLGRGSEIGFELDTSEFVPAAGQGTILLEARSTNGRAREAATAITDPIALLELNVERAAVASLDASCHTPVGILARVEGSGMKLHGFAGLPDGSEWVRDGSSTARLRHLRRRLELAARMKAAGAGEILEQAEEIGA